MMSAFFTYNELWIGCLTVVQSFIDIRLVLLEIWREDQVDFSDVTLRFAGYLHFFRKKTSIPHVFSRELCKIFKEHLFCRPSTNGSMPLGKC